MTELVLLAELIVLFLIMTEFGWFRFWPKYVCDSEAVVVEVFVSFGALLGGN